MHEETKLSVTKLPFETSVSQYTELHQWQSQKLVNYKLLPQCHKLNK